MESLPKYEERQSIVADLLREVQRARRVLLSADDECVEKAERHYRHALGVFSGLILSGGISDMSKAARYLTLRQRIHH